MTDKEVGELWKEFDGEHRTHFDYREHMRDLIYKLVEERARSIALDNLVWEDQESKQKCIQRARRDFGLPDK